MRASQQLTIILLAAVVGVFILGSLVVGLTDGVVQSTRPTPTRIPGASPTTPAAVITPGPIGSLGTATPTAPVPPTQPPAPPPAPTSAPVPSPPPAATAAPSPTPRPPVTMPTPTPRGYP